MEAGLPNNLDIANIKFTYSLYVRLYDAVSNFKSDFYRDAPDYIQQSFLSGQWVTLTLDSVIQ